MKVDRLKWGLLFLLINLVLRVSAQQSDTDRKFVSELRANAEKDWARSQSILRDGLLRDPRNADYHNLYAYAVRKGEKPNLDLVFKHYNEALRINPKHRGAHEYIGEAYLMVGNVGKAKEHLSALDQICFFGCDEYGLLKKAIGEFEAKGK